MSETQTVLGASAVAITQKVTYSAGATSFFAFIAKVDVIAWGGLTVAIVGLIIQFYFSIQRNKREQIEHEMRIAEYRQRMKNLKSELKHEINQ